MHLAAGDISEEIRRMDKQKVSRSFLVALIPWPTTSVRIVSVSVYVLSLSLLSRLSISFAALIGAPGPLPLG